MTWKIAAAFCLGALAAAASTRAAAQQTTITPGQMTQARVWIANHGRSEAVPVALREVGLEAPLQVQVVNGDAAHAAMQPLPVRVTRPVWEYTSVTVAADQDLARTVSARGAEGWETTGVSQPAPNGGVTLLLKRIR
jgi:hypothetical protein